MGESQSNQAGWKSVEQILHENCRPEEQKLIGIEIERIGIWPDCTPFRYESFTSENGEHRPGARDLINQLSEAHGWEKTNNENGDPLGLILEHGYGKITLEPGSQVELASDANKCLNTLVSRANSFEQKVDTLTNPWGINWVGIGVNLCNSVDELDVIPSPRYHIMTDYLGNKDTLGTSMMRLTGSVQVNLDYHSEAEAIEMLKVALAASPVSYALFSNSPIVKGNPTDYLSYRQAIWKKTDSDRTGLLHEVFEKDFGFEQYAKMVVKRPLMFAQATDGSYVKSNGMSLEEIESEKLENVINNKNNQLSTLGQLFPEARIKPGYIEVRSIDGQRPKERYASAAFWMGLLYSAEARKYVLETLGELSPDKKDQLLHLSATQGFKTSFKNISLFNLAKQYLALSRKCLIERGFGEEKYLEPIDEIIEKKECPAETLLNIYNSTDSGRVKKIISHCSLNSLD